MATYKGLELVVEALDSEHRGYFEEIKKGHLVVQRCGSCNMLRGSIGAGCPFCSSSEWTWQPVSGKGTIYSYEIVVQATQPAFRDWVPYPIVLVELDEQRAVPWHDGENNEFVSLRIIANLVGDDPSKPEAEENVAIGKRVELCIIDLDETMALPQFHLSPES